MLPEIEEYITATDWTLTCKEPGCSWTDYGERTENFMEEIQEAFRSHQNFHADPPIEPLTGFDLYLVDKYIPSNDEESGLGWD